MKITIPELALVAVIGPSGSGKSTFARKHFKPTEIISSDYCRGLVSDDENNQLASKDAFDVLYFIARKRLAAGRFTVVDATSVQPEARKPIVELAREFHCLPVAIVLDLPEKVCHERNQQRPDRTFGQHVVRQQSLQLRRHLRHLNDEGFRHIFVLRSQEDVDSVVIEREPLWNNLKHESGPFDIIGDVHGCYEELVELLAKLGYTVDSSPEGPRVIPPEGRKLIFLGDLVDRGPRIPDVMKLVMGMVAEGSALCVPGNHDIKLMRRLRGRAVQVKHGLAESLAQLSNEPPEFGDRLADFIDDLVSHYVLDDGKLVVAHAGMKETMQGRGSGKVRDFALYGETTGEIDDFGLPIRYNWAAEYRGRAMVVYGHTPVPDPEWVNRTVDIDTGCVFGGKLTALRYPELEFFSVPARKVYCQPAKPLVIEKPVLSIQQQEDSLLDMEDVLGKRHINTRLHSAITIREENAIAALEAMSRFAADPKWLIYLPPTMSPCETSPLPGMLEHPAEAFKYYQHEGIPKVICQQKHMGSRAVLIICQSADAARKRFGVVDDSTGACLTRTGRRFFDDSALENEMLACIRSALDQTGFWDEFKTDWVCLDAELMPWSAKAQGLVRDQYAAVGAAARAALGETVAALEQARSCGVEVQALLDQHRERQQLVQLYTRAYQQYCWPVKSLSDFKLAPFHLMATEGRVHFNSDHQWHMQTLAKICAGAPQLLLPTPHLLVDMTNADSQAEGIRWWEELTAAGGEGMVVKPLDFISRGRRGLVQPAIKCRGKEYLRIIYGPEYTIPANLERMKARGLSAKRSLAMREFSLGVESLERFVRRDALRHVHECVFGVLALESEPVDPRL